MTIFDKPAHHEILFSLEIVLTFLYVPTMAYFTMEITHVGVKPLLKFSGDLTKRGLTSLVKQATCVSVALLLWC